MIPRIKARVAQIEDPPEMKGKWIFEIFVGELGQPSNKPLTQIGPYDTEVVAHREMKRAVRLVCDEFERLTTGQITGRYIDMKLDEVRSWDEH